MNSNYSNYLSVHQPYDMSGWGECKERCEAMLEVFPELQMVRGHVLFRGRPTKPEPHWWLVDCEGNVLDPTINFDLHLTEYQPHDESGPEPTGECPNCSGYCYNDGVCCSDSCHNAYVAYCMNP